MKLPVYDSRGRCSVCGLSSAAHRDWCARVASFLEEDIRAHRDPVCTVDDCDRPHKARGFCRVHYMRWWNANCRGGSVLSEAS